MEASGCGRRRGGVHGCWRGGGGTRLGRLIHVDGCWHGHGGARLGRLIHVDGPHGHWGAEMWRLGCGAGSGAVRLWRVIRVIHFEG